MSEIKTPPFSTVGYLTYKRTYARALENGNTEEFVDTIQRVIDATDDQLNVGFTQEEKVRLFDYMFNLKATVAGRFLWQLGTKTVDTLGLASLQNCAACVVDHPVRPFTWAMDMLMVGAGVGYNIQRKYVDRLPKVSRHFSMPTRIDNESADFIVPDTREGWVQLLGKTLKAAFLAKERHTFTYSTQLVRGKGAPIKGFGGVASGPEDLCQGIERISTVLLNRAGKKMRPVDCLDIMNIIGAIVVAGNVRRSAQLAIGDCDDVEYLLAKRWDLGTIPSWRAMSNNSVACDDISDLHEFFWDGYSGKGEPYGLINLGLSQTVGRLGETEYADPDVVAYNPCAEQGLANYETCCLAEIYLPRFSSKAEMLDATKLLYRVAKHSLAMKCHHPETQKIVNDNMRMGIGVTGYMEATQEQIKWLGDVYTELRQYDIEYSKQCGFNTSIKLTTCKPSGTLSLLPGVTPGCHPAYARYMIRRISIASDSPLVAVCRAHGYSIEYRMHIDGTTDHSTVVVSFPFAYSDNATLAKDVSAVEQLKVVRQIQALWSDNAVSCTVYYRKDELPEIKKYLKRYYKDNHKTLSFLLHSDHGFKQAPFEEITKEQYEEMVSNTRLITSVSGDVDYESNDECASGVCPVR